MLVYELPSQMFQGSGQWAADQLLQNKLCKAAEMPQSEIWQPTLGYYTGRDKRQKGPDPVEIDAT